MELFDQPDPSGGGGGGGLDYMIFKDPFQPKLFYDLLENFEVLLGFINT